MGKRRGGKTRSRRGRPDAEHSGSEDEPLGEPPMPAPYVRLEDAEAQTHLGHGDADTLLQKIGVQKVLDDAKQVYLDHYVCDRATQTPGDAGSVWEVVQSIPGYHAKNDQDRVMLSRAAMHEHQIVLQCAQCKAGTLTHIIVVVALCAPMTCQSCGYTLMRPAGQSDKAAKDK